eukprot:gene24624-29751_t
MIGSSQEQAKLTILSSIKAFRGVSSPAAFGGLRLRSLVAKKELTEKISYILQSEGISAELKSELILTLVDAEISKMRSRRVLRAKWLFTSRGVVERQLGKAGRELCTKMSKKRMTSTDVALEIDAMAKNNTPIDSSSMETVNEMIQLARECSASWYDPFTTLSFEIHGYAGSGDSVKILKNKLSQSVLCSVLKSVKSLGAEAVVVVVEEQALLCMCPFSLNLEFAKRLSRPPPAGRGYLSFRFRLLVFTSSVPAYLMVVATRCLKHIGHPTGLSNATHANTLSNTLQSSQRRATLHVDDPCPPISPSTGAAQAAHCLRRINELRAHTRPDAAAIAIAYAVPTRMRMKDNQACPSFNDRHHARRLTAYNPPVLDTNSVQPSYASYE